SSKTMAERLGSLAETCLEQIKSPNESSNEFRAILEPHFISLMKSKSSDLGIWTAVAGLLMDFNSQAVPQAPTSITSIASTSAIPPKGYDNTGDQSVLNTLHGKWTGDYLPESLDAL